MIRYIYLLIFLFSLVDVFSQNIPREDLIFDINNEKGNENLYNELKNDSLTKNIKVIRFVGFDSIPDYYTLFSEVNTVILESSDTKGLDVFPSLEFLYLIESGGFFNEKESWLKKIKRIYIHKTYSVEGITSFKNIPLLEEIVLSYSGFDIFPSDLDSLENIRKIVLGAYTGAIIDLNLIDLNKIPSLQELEIISWLNNITGIPKGLKNSHLLKLKIQHPNLTQKEKRIISNYKNDR
jgi:hypothetical protein